MSEYRTSPEVCELFTALSAAQKVMTGASKDATNPHFGSKYADLASVWEACRGPLAENGLAVLQPVSADGSKVTVTTVLVHKSGQWIASDLALTSEKSTPQGVGSAITYGRRYGLASMVGIAPEDDDGNAASDVTGKAKKAQAEVVAKKTGQPAGQSQLFEALKAFGAMKEALGSQIYYFVLSANGFQKSNEITDEATAKKVYKQMVGVKKLADAASHGEVLEGMTAQLYNILPETTHKAINRELATQLVAAFGTDVGSQEFSEMSTAASDKWDLLNRVRAALAEYDRQMAAQ